MAEFLKKYPIEAGPFEATWDSLRQYQVPDWFRDAKFGIWSHWGPQAVPMVGDWYARRMYIEGEYQYLHHWRTYGHPSKVGYKDIIKLWKAEKFDPEGLMDLYVSAGAKYFFAQGVHHDNFDNWDSKHHPWNAVKMGPGKNIVGMWEKAARSRGLKFGISEHLGASYSWFAPNKGADQRGPFAGVPYDGKDPANSALYYAGHGDLKSDIKKNWPIDPWYTTDVSFHEQWFRRMKDLVDQHQPDVLYSDGGLPWDKVGLSIVAHLYNLSAKKHGKNLAVYNQKDTKAEVYSIGVLDIERGNANEAASYVWQNDTCVGGWYYDVRQVYKTPELVLETLVDCVSKNGNMLLNVIQRPDGSLDEECLHIVKTIGAWMK
jgi:alpha-L-fucosidase